MVENTDPIVFYLYNAFNSEEVRQLLIDKFRSSGHCRRIDFIDWDCLNEKPPRGGDLYIFDSVVLSHMCANSYAVRPSLGDRPFPIRLAHLGRQACLPHLCLSVGGGLYPHLQFEKVSGTVALLGDFI